MERETRLQSDSKVWHSFRADRITSSVFKQVIARIADSDSLTARLLKKNIQTKVMKYSIEHEPIAARHYANLTKNNVYPCGLVINPSAPHLGSSPDRHVHDVSASPPFGLLEIKCPD